MKKRDLKKLAIIGLTSGIIVTAQAAQANAADSEANQSLARGEGSRSRGEGGCGGFKEIPGFLLAVNDTPASKSTTDTKNDSSASTDVNSQNMGYHLMTEKELLEELNDEGAKLYNSLDAEGKLLARKVASARCNGTNECAQLNACETEKNKCAGQGKCKGTGKCAIADKNLAVKLVAKKMANKRSDAVNSK